VLRSTLHGRGLSEGIGVGRHRRSLATADGAAPHILRGSGPYHGRAKPVKGAVEIGAVPTVPINSKIVSVFTINSLVGLSTLLQLLRRTYPPD
jgi:hypothetical protein